MYAGGHLPDFKLQGKKAKLSFCPSFEITTSHETQIVDFLSSFTMDFVGPQGCQSRTRPAGTASKEDP